MHRHAQRRTGVARLALLVPALVVSLAGCAQQAHFTGHSGTCRYGLGAGRGGLDCYRRAKPSSEAIAQAMSPRTLERALAAWRASHGASVVASVGINWWAETTISVRRGEEVTFDVNGRRTSGNDGYIASAHDPFPIDALRPKVFARLLEEIRTGQPSTRLAKAVLSVDPFSHTVSWRFTMVSPDVQSDVLYMAAADGSEFCHGHDFVKDSLVAAPGVPACADGILPF